jgi:[ribosomal protein S18]-alanine N-acetyltransferase
MDINKDKIYLKRAGVEDILTLISIEEKVSGLKTYSNMVTEDEWKQSLAKSVVYLIFMGENVVGNISYEKKPDNVVYIDGFIVDPKYQKQGIGKETVRLIMDELQSAKRIELATHPENASAIKIYSSFGFIMKEKIENYFGDGEPRIIMVKENSKI